MVMVPTDINRLDSVADVDAWVEAGGDVNQLRHVLKDPNMHTYMRSTPAIKAWFDKEAARHADRTAEISERATRAAETSAAAANESAKWSRWAVVVAVTALLVSAWPHISK